MSRTEPILGASLDELRRTRTSVKWQAYGHEAIPVWVAEMDARPCPPVVEAVTSALGRGDTGYAWTAEYVRAATDFAKRRWDWSPDPGAAMSVPDVMSGIEALLVHNVPREAGVVLSPPCYDSFYGFVAATGRRLVKAPLGADLRLDLDALDRAFVEAGPGGAYVLCNPQNPTGTVHTADELRALARLADERRILVLSDEIHAPLVQPGTTYTPYLSLPEAARGVALMSGSKAFNLAGIKAALAFAGPDAKERLAALPEVLTHGANHLGVIAATAAYDHGGPWLDQLLGELADRRRLLGELLAQRFPDVRPVPSQATFLAWLDCRGLGVDDPAATFRRGGVIVSAGTWYDPDQGAGWVRFNLGTSPEVITAAVDRMAAALEPVE